MIGQLSTRPLYLVDSPTLAYATAVNTSARIQRFLAAVRGVLRRRAAARAGLLALAGLCALGLAVPLLGLAVDARHGTSLGWAGLVLAAGMAAAALLVGVIGPLRRWRGDRSVARFVGAREPRLASDLLSAVQLGAASAAGPASAVGPERPERAARSARSGQGSAELVGALIDQVAARVAVIEPAALVAHRPVRRAAMVCAAVAAVHVATLLVAPSLVRAGWERVLTPLPPGAFGGAAMSDIPLVGDLRVTLEYPAYTGRPSVVLPSASGDLRAMPGTVVTLETTALIPVASARLLLDPAGEESVVPPAQAAGQGRAQDEQAGAGPAAHGTPAARNAPAGTEIMVELLGERTLRTRFPVDVAASYRFLLESPGGKRQVEATARQIEIEPDRPPEVELYAPADELDVTSLKRVELAYIAEDDHGIDKVELVWEDRGTVQRKPLPAPGTGRSAQGKFLWDLAEISLEPGAQVSYHVEATDNDVVSGPNVGRSRSFTLRVFSPREKHEQLIARQRELFEKMLRSLGGRLTVEAEDVNAFSVLQREAAEIVVELGTLVAALGSDELADRSLRTELDDMRTRLDRLVKAEAGLLARLAARPTGAGKQQVARLAAHGAEVVAALEDDIIRLADWLDRQQMETLLAISDEIKTHQDRLRQLFKEYERSSSPEILAEIEREMRALERRLAEMAASRGQMAEDVLDRFVNSEAMEDSEVVDCMTEVRALMSAGQVAEAQQKLEACMGTLDRAAEAMEQALRALRGDRFSEEERKLGELMDKLADLAQDQRELAGDAEELWNRYASRAEELMREETRETRKRAARSVERLRKQLERVPESGLTPFAKEELDIVGSRLRDVDEMLSDGDIAEALAMAEQARAGLETAATELDAAMAEQDEPWNRSGADARRELGRARPLADKLVEELEASTPSPGEIMSTEDRRQLERLRRRQQGVAERARRLAERAQQMGADVPGQAGEAIAEGVEGARGHMERAGTRMRARDPAGTRQETRGAADALERTLESGRDAARGRQAMGRAGMRDEPIRIPGADEYRAPEKFREDILEAMKREQAPEGFGDLVRRYYEELIR